MGLNLTAAASSPRILAPLDNCIINIFGAKGQGKTTRLLELYRATVQAGGRATLVDSTGRLRGAAEWRPRAGNVTAGVVESPAGWWALVRRALRAGEPWNIIIRPAWGVEMRPLWVLLMELGERGAGSLLAIDEAEKHANAHRIDRGLDRLVSEGRNYQVSIVSTVRLPPELHGRLRGLADVTVSFRQVSRHYAQIIARDAMHDAPGAEELLPRLPDHVFLAYRASSGRLTRGRVRPI